MMNADQTNLDRLLAEAAKRETGPCEAQRRSFAYGTSHIENETITRSMIDEEADRFGR